MSQFPKRQTLQDVAAVIADGNNLSTLHGIEQYPSLVQVYTLQFTSYSHNTPFSARESSRFINRDTWLVGKHLFVCFFLFQLSACDNSLIRMDEVAPLINLVTLNLQTNSIMDTTGMV